MKSNPADSIEPSSLFPAKYMAIDGWRGIAATIVVLQHVVHHMNLNFSNDPIFDFGHEAVMMFFAISGYCIAAAVASCVQKGYGFRTFMIRRVRRIYPPYMLAALYWIVTRVVKTSTLGGDELNRPWTDYVQNFTLTQWISRLWTPSLNSVDNPVNFIGAYWSLGYEEQFYLLMGAAMVTLPVLRVPFLTMATVMALVSLLYRILFNEFRGIFIEYWAQFYFGVIVFHRLCLIESRRKRLIIDIGLAAFFLASTLAASEIFSIAEYQKKLAIELVVTSGFSLLLILTRHVSDKVMHTRVGAGLIALGTISYSLYLLNQCNLRFAKGVADRLIPATISVAGNVLAQLIVHLALAAAFWFVCERPFLNKSLPTRVGLSTNAAA